MPNHNTANRESRGDELGRARQSIPQENSVYNLYEYASLFAPGELREIHRMRNQGRTPAEIARALGKKANAIHNLYFRLGLTSSNGTDGYQDRGKLTVTRSVFPFEVGAKFSTDDMYFGMAAEWKCWPDGIVFASGERTYTVAFGSLWRDDGYKLHVTRRGTREWREFVDAT